MEWLKVFNNSYAQAIQALTPFVIGFISWSYFKLYKESKINEGDAASMIKPVFWTIGKNYKILAVHKFEISDDLSGYKHIGQNSRPDQWEKLIKIKSNYCNLRHEVEPVNPSDILTIVISRNGKEKWRSIPFHSCPK